MKRTLALAAVLAGTLFCAPGVANAGDWSFGVGFGSHGGHFNARYRGGHRHYRKHHAAYHHGYRHYRPAQRTRGCWVPPAYKTIVVGYDHCGDPIYRTILVRRGYYSY